MNNENTTEEEWEENGEIQCATHGGDHVAIILVNPKDPTDLRYRCTMDGSISE